MESEVNGQPTDGAIGDLPHCELFHNGRPRRKSRQGEQQGLTRAAGREPALAASICPFPLALRIASAIWLRAELPVQRNRTRKVMPVCARG